MSGHPSADQDEFSQRLQQQLSSPQEEAPESGAGAAAQPAAEAQAESGGPVGSGEHQVRQGECISSIAKDTGHYWKTIWNDSANAQLREVRQDPNVLRTEDRLRIPEIRPKQEPCTAEMRHRFVRRGEPAMVRLRVLMEDDQPRANQPYTLEIGGQTYQGTTDPNGQLQAPIPGNAQRGKLTVGPDNVVFKLSLGVLDPITELSGVQGRLNNLGFNVGRADGVLGSKTKAALRHFQRSNGLEPTGRPDQATRDKLKQVHGS
ncbi:MAG: peptidoglycan-binding protein [Phycisphaerae bacterium]